MVTSANTGIFGEHAQQRPVCLPPNSSYPLDCQRTWTNRSRRALNFVRDLNRCPYKQLALRLSSCFVQRLKRPHQTIESNSAKYQKSTKYVATPQESSVCFAQPITQFENAETPSCGRTNLSYLLQRIRLTRIFT